MADAEYERLRREFLARLEHPLGALETLTETRGTLDRVERLLVQEARRSCSTWAEIGAVLGVSRQAAHRRHRRAVNETDGVWHVSGTCQTRKVRTAPQ